MGVKRTKKRKNNLPRTKIKDFGFGKRLSKIDKAIELLDKKSK